MIVGVVLLQVFARPLVSLFDITQESTELCVSALRIASWGLLFGGVNVIMPGICQALGNGIYSLIISALRYVVVVLPVAFVFSLTSAAESLVWLAIPIAEIVACIVAVVLTRRLYKQCVSVLD